jgi:hypothetical protein
VFATLSVIVTVIREHHSGVDVPFVCVECEKERAEIVLEDFPTTGEHVSLCRHCAAVALSEHPRLLASAVVSLILTTHKAVKVES